MKHWRKDACLSVHRVWCDNRKVTSERGDKASRASANRRLHERHHTPPRVVFITAPSFIITYVARLAPSVSILLHSRVYGCLPAYRGWSWSKGDNRLEL